MRTRYIPAGIMLIAGAVTCIISIVQRQDIVKSLTTLLIVLILFYVIGLIAKFFVEKILKDFKEKDTKETFTEEADGEDAKEMNNAESQNVANDSEVNDKNRL